MSDLIHLRDVESEGIAAICASDGGAFPFSALRVDSFGVVWHDGSEFDGDIVCHGPFRLHSQASETAGPKCTHPLSHALIAPCPDCGASETAAPKEGGDPR